MIQVFIDGKEYRAYDHLYYVAKDGSLLRRMEPIKPKKWKDGYMRVGRQRTVHRMVATCWLTRPEGYDVVHHKDHSRDNNHADNLQWMTQKAHMTFHPNCGHHTVSEATREKLRQYRLGAKHSPETIEKIRAGALNRVGASRGGWKHGMKHTLQTRKKMSEDSPRCQPCLVDGDRYPSFKVAGNTLGIRPLTLRKRCLSKNFDNYSLTE